MPSLSIASRALLFGLVVVIPPIQVAIGADAHLLPVGPTFDIPAPIGESYSRVAEKMLFAEPSWLVRYYSSTESATTGLSIARTSGGHYRLSIKKARPQLGSVVANAFYQKLDFSQALATVKVESAETEMPETVAVAVHRLWLSLLRDVYKDEKLDPPYLLSAEMILYGRTPDGKTLAGKIPPAGFKYHNLAKVDDIVENLFKAAFGPATNRKNLFVSIGKKATALTRKEANGK